jgi:hypothetical protein
MRQALVMVALVGLASMVTADSPIAAPVTASAPASAATSSAPGVMNLGAVRVDVTARTVSFDAKVAMTEGALEFLVCRSASKEYESLLSTNAKGWQIHAGLLALGLTPGKPARWSTPADGEPRFMPPQGAGLTIVLNWTDGDGKKQSAPAGSWIKVPGVSKVQSPTTWVFVGSDLLADGTYAADKEGDLISVANFADAVIDVPFESSSSNALREFVVAPSAPAKDTPVEVVIKPVDGAERADHARVMMEIDRFGRVWHEGRRVLSDDLPKWAREYLSRHAKGQVTLRVDARALAYDIYRTRDELRLGGLWDVEEEYRLPANDEPVAPRSADEAKRSIEWWAAQFARAAELIFDPALEAQNMLRQVERQIQEMRALEAVLTDYSRQLGPMLEKYRASTQPTAASRPVSPS